MKIIKRGESWDTMKRYREKKNAEKRREKARKAQEERDKVPEHWKNVSEEERLEDYERTKNKAGCRLAALAWFSPVIVSPPSGLAFG